MDQEYDIVISGAGAVGGLTALRLTALGYRVLLTDAFAEVADQRQKNTGYGLAMSAATISFIEKMDLWQDLSEFAAPIAEVHVSEVGRFGKTRISARRFEREALGYVVDSQLLQSQIMKRLQQQSVDVLRPVAVEALALPDEKKYLEVVLDHGRQKLTTKLLIAADSSDSEIRRLCGMGVREKNYRQTAFVTGLKTEFAHRGRAYERFTQGGVVALLPQPEQNHSYLVWVMPNAAMDDVGAVSRKVFETELQKVFGNWLGRIAVTEDIRSFPLRQKLSRRLIGERVVLIGNAANQLHPVAGQGLNLGIRDIAALGRALAFAAEHKSDPGDAALLQGYEKSRIKDHQSVARFTDTAVSCNSPGNRVSVLNRSLLMSAINYVPTAKKVFSRFTMGLLPFQSDGIY